MLRVLIADMKYWSAGPLLMPPYITKTPSELWGVQSQAVFHVREAILYRKTGNTLRKHPLWMLSRLFFSLHFSTWESPDSNTFFHFYWDTHNYTKKHYKWICSQYVNCSRPENVEGNSIQSGVSASWEVCWGIMCEERLEMSGLRSLDGELWIRRARS